MGSKWFASLVYATIAHCSGCASPARLDGGADAAYEGDARVDAPTDDATTRSDAADADLAALCAEVSNTPEQWRRLPFACECDARIAGHPEAAAPPLRWTPCAEHADCFDLVADWRAPGAMSAQFEFRGREAGGELFVFYGRRNADLTRDRFILSRIDGPPLVAWDIAAFGPSGRRGCVGVPLAGPVFGLELWWSPDAASFRNYVSIGDATNGPDWRTRVVNFVDPRWERAELPPISGYGRDVAFAYGSTLWRSDPTTQSLEPIAEGADLRGLLEATQVYEQQSWFLLSQTDRITGTASDVSLGVVEGRLPARIVYHPNPPRVLSYILTDQHVVLEESEPQVTGVGPTMIRVAPRTTAAAYFVPRDIWRVPSNELSLLGASMVGGGWLALVTRPDGNPLQQRLVLIRLSDGARYELGSEARPFSVSYITANEVALMHVKPDRSVSIRRIALRSLGAPLPPSL